MGVYKYIFCNKMIISRQKLELRCLIIDMKYVNKQTMNMYINKQTTAKAEFNPNSIKNLFNVKMTFKNLFHNLIQNITNLKIFMTWPNKQYVYKQTNNMYINKETTVKAGFNPNSIKSFINVKTTFKNIFHNLIYIDFIIFYLLMGIKIGNVSK